MWHNANYRRTRASGRSVETRLMNSVQIHTQLPHTMHRSAKFQLPGVIIPFSFEALPLPFSTTICHHHGLEALPLPFSTPPCQPLSKKTSVVWAAQIARGWHWKQPGTAMSSSGGSICLSYWIQHLQKSGTQLQDNDQVYQFLQEHLLHWPEALCWMRRVSEGIHAITLLEPIDFVWQRSLRLAITH